MDLQKEQNSDAHGSGWMLVICKHWNWNWHWDWKYYIFLTRGGNIVWVTAFIKLRDFLVKWSRDICKTLYLPFPNIYGHQNWHSGNLLWGSLPFKATWPFDYVVTWQIKKTFICAFTMPMVIELGRVINLPSEEVTFIRWPCDQGVTCQM